MRMGRSSRTVVGVDIGRHTIKAAQLQVTGGQCRTDALLLLPRPQPDQEIGAADALAIRKILNRQGFSGNRIAIAAPEQKLLRTTLEVPAKVSGESAAQIVRMELSRLHNVAPDSFEMAYWELKDANNPRPMTQTLAVGCPHEAANALLDVFEDARFRVVALDLRSAAVTRACRPLLLPSPQITAIVDLGWRSTSVLFVCGRSLIYERSVQGAPIGELTVRLTETFAIPPASAYQIIGTIGPGMEELTGQFDRESLEAIRKHMRAHFDQLLEELRVPLSYANHQFGGEGVKRLLLIGGGAAVPALASYFEARLGIEVKRAAPSDLVESSPELASRASNPALTCAVGLAQSREPDDERCESDPGRTAGGKTPKSSTVSVGDGLRGVCLHDRRRFVDISRGPRRREPQANGATGGRRQADRAGQSDDAGPSPPFGGNHDGIGDDQGDPRPARLEQAAHRTICSAR